MKKDERPRLLNGWAHHQTDRGRRRMGLNHNDCRDGHPISDARRLQGEGCAVMLRQRPCRPAGNPQPHA